MRIAYLLFASSSAIGCSCLLVHGKSLVGHVVALMEHWRVTGNGRIVIGEGLTRKQVGCDTSLFLFNELIVYVGFRWCKGMVLDAEDSIGKIVWRALHLC